MSNVEELGTCAMFFKVHDGAHTKRDDCLGWHVSGDGEEQNDEPPTCARCGDEYLLRVGNEPSKYCDPCAQERVIELESAQPAQSIEWNLEIERVRKEMMRRFSDKLSMEEIASFAYETFGQHAQSGMGARMTAEQLAEKFHIIYERIAPEYGYKTNSVSAKPFSQIPENLRKLMIAVCGEILAANVLAEKE